MMWVGSIDGICRKDTQNTDLTFLGVFPLGMIEQQLARAETAVKWLADKGKALTFPETARSVVVMASGQLVAEHYTAAVSLCKLRRYSTFLAVLRPIYEGMIWTTWLHLKATAEQITLLANDRLTPSLESMVNALDRESFYGEPMLAEMKPVISRMDAFTHGGYEHLRYRIHENLIEPRYPDDLVGDGLQLAGVFALMAFFELLTVSDSVESGDMWFLEAQGLIDSVQGG
jgi:hypothetical protein